MGAEFATSKGYTLGLPSTASDLRNISYPRSETLCLRLNNPSVGELTRLVKLNIYMAHKI